MAQPFPPNKYWPAEPQVYLLNLDPFPELQTHIQFCSFEIYTWMPKSHTVDKLQEKELIFASKMCFCFNSAYLAKSNTIFLVVVIVQAPCLGILPAFCFLSKFILNLSTKFTGSMFKIMRIHTLITCSIIIISDLNDHNSLLLVLPITVIKSATDWSYCSLFFIRKAIVTFSKPKS